MPKRTSDIATDRSDDEIAEAINACLTTQGFNRRDLKEKHVWRKGLIWAILVSSRVTGGIAHVEVWNPMPIPGMESFLMFFLNTKKLPKILETVVGAIGGTTAPPTPQTEVELRYAGFWRRTGAALIDLLLFYIVFGTISAVSLRLLRGAGGREALLMTTNIIMLVSLCGAWLYFAILESSASQGTLGKKVFGIKVGNDRGERVSFGRASGRFWSKFVSALPLGIGFLLAAFTDKKKALHDFMSGTVVIQR